MVTSRNDDSWTRRGCSLLWSPKLLKKIATPDQVVSIRQFFEISNDWPEDLPALNDNALVVAGLEGCLDILDHNDSEQWIRHDIKDKILSFQEEYQGDAALIFWLPSAKGRLTMSGSTEEYFWKQSSNQNSNLPIGKLLFAGAENEVERILDPGEDNQDLDGKAWSGLYHPRIS